MQSALRFVNRSHRRCRGGESSHPGPGQSLEPVWGPSGEETRASWASLLAPRQSTDGTFSPLELLVLSTTLMDGVRRIFQFFQGWRKRACWVSTGYACAQCCVASVPDSLDDQVRLDFSQHYLSSSDYCLRIHQPLRVIASPTAQKLQRCRQLVVVDIEVRTVQLVLPVNSSMDSAPIGRVTLQVERSTGRTPGAHRSTKSRLDLHGRGISVAIQAGVVRHRRGTWAVCGVRTMRRSSD